MNAPNVHPLRCRAVQRILIGNRSKNAELDVLVTAAEYQWLASRQASVEHLVRDFGERFGLTPVVANAVLAGSTRARIEEGYLVIEATEQADRPSSAADTPRHSTDSAPTVPASTAARVDRADRLLILYAAKVAQEEQLTREARLSELLCDLRHWCDADGVVMYKALDQSYVRYMHTKFGGLDRQPE